MGSEELGSMMLAIRLRTSGGRKKDFTGNLWVDGEYCSKSWFCYYNFNGLLLLVSFLFLSALGNRRSLSLPIVTFPLDLTKTRLQIQGEAALKQRGEAGLAGPYRGMVRTAVGIVQEEGLLKLWQGATPAVYRHIGNQLESPLIRRRYLFWDSVRRRVSPGNKIRTDLIGDIDAKKSFYHSN